MGLAYICLGLEIFGILRTDYGIHDIASSFFSGLIHVIYLVYLLDHPIDDSSSRSGGGVEIEAITLEQNNDGIRISEKAKEVVVNYSMIIDILQSMFLFTSLIHFSSCLW